MASRNVVDILINATDNASSKVQGVQQSFKNLESTMAKAEEGSQALLMGVAAVATGLGALLAVGFEQNKMLEGSSTAWETLTGSVKGAEEQTAHMLQLAKDSPFDYKSIDQSTKSLVGYGMELETANKWLPSIMDTVSVLGGGSDQIGRIGMAIGQMMAKGKVSAEEMNQLSENGINGWKMLADSMGLSVGEVRKMSEEGKLLASDALPIIQAGMDKTFGGGMQEYMKTTAGQMDNFIESAKVLAGQMSQPIYDWFGAVVLPKLQGALEAVEDAISSKTLQEGLDKLFSPTTQATIAMITGAILIGLVPALYGIATAVWAAMAPLIPFLALGAALGLLAYAIWQNWEPIKEKFGGLFDTIKKFADGFVEQFKLSWQMLLDGIAPIWEAIKTLMKSLEPILIIIGAAIGLFLTIAIAVFNGIVAAIAPLVEAFVWLMDMVVNVVMSIVKLLTGDMKGASESWKKATDSAIKFVKALWEGIKNFFKGFVGTFVAILQNFGVDVKSKFQEMWQAAKQKAEEGWNRIKDGFGKFVSSVGKAVTDFGKRMKDGFKKTVDGAKEAFMSGLEALVSKITGFGSTFLKAGTGLLEAFTDGVKKGIGKAQKAVENGMKKIRDFLPFSPAKKGALSDLDKSGASFFPTFASKMHKTLPKAIRTVRDGMGELAPSNFNDGFNFTGGTQRVKSSVSVSSEHVVRIEGDTSRIDKQTLTSGVVDTASESIQELFGGLRQSVRKQ